MFETYFLFSSIIFIKDLVKFDYSSSVDDETPMTHREIIKIIHKINLNKIFEINKVINRTLRQFVYVVVE